MTRWSLLLLIVLASGCEQDQIRTYVAEKDAPLEELALEPQAPAVPTRMLAAIVPQDDNLWFFKVTGPPEELAKLTEQFGTFVASTRFENGVPTWQAPDDWIEGPQKPLRIATYYIGAGKDELSISVLGQGDDLNESLLANVNRWRGQLELGPLSMAQLLAREVPEADGELIEISAPAGKVLLVNFVGKMSSSGSMPPFARQPSAVGPSTTAPRNPAPPAGKLTYTTPTEWKEDPPQGMRLASFQIRNGNQVAETTIIVASGNLLDNVNRWREQVALAPWTAEELAEQKQTLAAGEIMVDSVALFGDVESILGAVFEHAGRTWFVKLKGPTAVVRKEQPRFEGFVRSIRFE